MKLKKNYKKLSFKSKIKNNNSTSNNNCLYIVSRIFFNQMIKKKTTFNCLQLFIDFFYFFRNSCNFS